MRTGNPLVGWLDIPDNIEKNELRSATFYNMMWYTRESKFFILRVRPVDVLVQLDCEFDMLADWKIDNDPRL